MSMAVVYQYNGEAANRTVVVSYGDAYNDICVVKNIRNSYVDSSYCSDLQALSKNGQIFYGFATVAMVMAIISFLMAFIVTLVRCCCKKPMNVCAHFVTASTTLSLLSSVVAMFVSWNGFMSNAVSVLSVVYGYYFPVAQFDTEWNDARVGSSLVCLYLGIACGLISLLLVFLEKRRRGAHNNTVRRSHPRDGPALLEAEGQEANNFTIQAYPQVGTPSGLYRV